MDEYQFSLLGPPHLKRDAQLVTVARRKHWGLLTYLLLTRQPQVRDSLATLFWPTCSQEHARADLRRELARLRSQLPGLVLCYDSMVALRQEPAPWVDVWEFERHLAAAHAHDHALDIYCPTCVAHLEAAHALYRDDLLAGYSLADSPAFEEWHFFQQESLRNQLLELLGTLARLQIAGGDLPQAILLIRQRLAIEPLHEESHQQLMWLYAHTGQRAASLRQFNECKHVLANELGIDPTPETFAIYHQIMAQPVTPSAPDRKREGSQWRDSGSRQQEQPPAPAFVGREQQLHQLQAQLDAACSGMGRVVFVTGEAGAGKTALLAEFARRAMAQHAELIVADAYGTALFGADAPLLPFRCLLATLTGDFEYVRAERELASAQTMRVQAFSPHVLHALVTAGPHLVGSMIAGDRLLATADAAYLNEAEDYERLRTIVTAHPAGEDEPESQHLILTEVGEVLHVLAAQRPLLLLLDDLHWADSLSLNLLFHLGKRLRAQSILIVGAYRPSQVAVVDSDRSHGSGLAAHHPLIALTHEFMRDFGPNLVDLETETADAARAWLDGFLAAEACQLSPMLRDSLFAQTHGQPLFTKEIIGLWREQGWLYCTEARVWCEASSPDLSLVPPRVAAAIQCRLDRVSDKAARLLTVASAEGETFTLGAIAAALQWSERETLEILATELHHQHHLVTELATGEGATAASYRFANPMIRTYLLSQLDQCELRLLRSTLCAPEQLPPLGLQTRDAAERVTDGLGTQSGMLVGRVQPILKRGMVNGHEAFTLQFEPACPLAEIAHPERSKSMYHRWHFNYSTVILLICILLAIWAVTYAVMNTRGLNIGDLWPQTQDASLPAEPAMIPVAPGYAVPSGYFVQEKTYREPALVSIAPGFVVPKAYYIQEKAYHAPEVVSVAPGLVVPKAYYIQEKTYHAPEMVSVAPGFVVPKDYYIQEKMYHAPEVVSVAPGYVVPKDYYIQEKTYREEAALK